LSQFVTSIDRAPEGLVQMLRDQATATVYEAAGQRGAMDGAIRQMTPGLGLCGSALTVRCQPADNLTLHAAIAMAEPGDVIVADVGDLVDAGHWGEITTVAARSRGVAGLVINGGVRDVRALAEREFPVFARGSSMRATTKQIPGLINHPITCGGVAIRPGDLVLGDEDGVVVVERESAEKVLRAADERERNEAEVMRRLEAGELTLDVLGFREALGDSGRDL
jgi:4-hydroxy-4-methyl-2-oxoglutarate aldolase